MLELQHVSYSVEEEGLDKEILKDVSLTIEDGTFLVVTGPNGGGKSSLAKVIMGVNKVSGGKILLDGEDITDLDITERAKRGIGFAFQTPVTFKGIRVVDLLRMARGKQISVMQACDYLSQVGLCAKDYIEREVNGSLSGGELKRIEIATVLARGAKLSLFDEPEAGIDIWSFQNLIRVFESVRRNVEGSVMVISHQERILGIADKIAVIEDGHVAQFGPREEVLPRLLGTASAVNAACSRLE